MGIVANLVILFILVGLGFTALGFMVAWTVDTTAGYHAIMSVVFIPLWLLSGALFPLESSAVWLNWVMRLNPITYAMTIIRIAFYQPFSSLATDGDFLFALAITLVWTLLTLAGSVLIITRKADV